MVDEREFVPDWYEGEVLDYEEFMALEEAPVEASEPPLAA